MKKKNEIKIYSVLLIIINYLYILWFGKFVYYTNDDWGIQSVLSGYSGGEPFPIHQFIGACISYPISMLYKLIPQVQWWFIWSHCLLIIGMYFIHKCFLSYAKQYNIQMPVALIVLESFDFLFLIGCIEKIGFTMVSTVFGTGAIAFILLKKDSLKKIDILKFALMYIICICQRQASAKVILCYFAVAFMFVLFEKGISFDKKRVVFYGIVLSFLFLTLNALTVFDKNIKTNINGENFREFNSARSMYMDWPHDSYYDNPQLYHEYGWNENTYLMTTCWIFADERITADSMYGIAKTKSAEVNKNDVILDNNTDILFALSIISSVILIFGCFIARKQIRLVYLCNILGTFVLYVYMYYKGRVLYRSVFAVFLPYILIQILFIIDVFHKTIKKNEEKILNVLIILFVILITYFSRDLFENSFVEDVLSEEEREVSLMSYLERNQDNLYIKDVGMENNISPKIYDVEYYGNAISCGGCAYKSKIYYSILDKFGYDEINKELFRNENVYFMSLVDVQTEDYYPGLDFVSLIYKWLRQDTDMIGIAKVDVLDGGINVYKVLYSEDDVLQINNKNKMVVYGLGNNGDYCYVKDFDLTSYTIRGIEYDSWSGKEIEITDYAFENELSINIGKSYVSELGETGTNKISIYVDNVLVDEVDIDVDAGETINLNNYIQNDRKLHNFLIEVERTVKQDISSELYRILGVEAIICERNNY